MQHERNLGSGLPTEVSPLPEDIRAEQTTTLARGHGDKASEADEAAAMSKAGALRACHHCGSTDHKTFQHHQATGGGRRSLAVAAETLPAAADADRSSYSSDVRSTGSGHRRGSFDDHSDNASEHSQHMDASGGGYHSRRYSGSSVGSGSDAGTGPAGGGVTAHGGGAAASSFDSMTEAASRLQIGDSGVGPWMPSTAPLSSMGITFGDGPDDLDDAALDKKLFGVASPVKGSHAVGITAGAGVAAASADAPVAPAEAPAVGTAVATVVAAGVPTTTGSLTQASAATTVPRVSDGEAASAGAAATPPSDARAAVSATRTPPAPIPTSSDRTTSRHAFAAVNSPVAASRSPTLREAEERPMSPRSAKSSRTSAGGRFAALAPSPERQIERRLERAGRSSDRGTGSQGRGSSLTRGGASADAGAGSATSGSGRALNERKIRLDTMWGPSEAEAIADAREFMQRFGKITSVNTCTNRSVGEGYWDCYVEFASKEHAAAAKTAAHNVRIQGDVRGGRGIQLRVMYAWDRVTRLSSSDRMSDRSDRHSDRGSIDGGDRFPDNASVTSAGSGTSAQSAGQHAGPGSFEERSPFLGAAPAPLSGGIGAGVGFNMPIGGLMSAPVPVPSDTSAVRGIATSHDKPARRRVGAPAATAFSGTTSSPAAPPPVPEPRSRRSSSFDRTEKPRARSTSEDRSGRRLSDGDSRWRFADTSDREDGRDVPSSGASAASSASSTGGGDSHPVDKWINDRKLRIHAVFGPTKDDAKIAANAFLREYGPLSCLNMSPAYDLNDEGQAGYFVAWAEFVSRDDAATALKALNGTVPQKPGRPIGKGLEVTVQFALENNRERPIERERERERARAMVRDRGADRALSWR